MISINKKTSAIIQARMGSSRLPGKVMMKLKGKPLIDYLIERLRYVEEFDEIIVATSISTLDDKLANHLQNQGIKVFRGSEENVLKRVYDTANFFNVDIIVEITGDCPIIDPNIVSQVIRIYNNNNYDYVTNSNIRSYPDGMDVAVFSTQSLGRALSLAKDPDYLEHVTLFFKNNPKKFSHLNILATPDQHLPELGLTLDERDDYKLITEIVNNLHNDKFPFDLRSILNFLSNNKKIININKHVKRKKVKTLSN